MALYLASRTVAGRDIQDEVVDPFIIHSAVIAELLALTEQALGDPALADDSLSLQ
ncbi:hypothetical protein ACFV2H_07150 [Streptomyces sp. NPDC059629]|uniref:hypothetical protein n=1 Tax=Streptomyces sp. NPDC059629 TaxID=3346889 RepID=UPI003678D958